jgi:diadenosine tetraphosphate (Ap4A) HIT family hydrolase
MPDYDGPPPYADCPFCNRALVQNTHLHEGRDFYVIADHAPIAEAHLLLIPRVHLPYLASLPSALDEEFESLKAMLGSFVEKNYGAVSFWENGGFGQTVPHAHLHAFSVPVDPAIYRAEGAWFTGIAGLRERHLERPGQYFMVEHAQEAQILPPDWDVYMRIVDHARANSAGHFLRSREERRARGVPLIEVLKRRWDEDLLTAESTG